MRRIKKAEIKHISLVPRGANQMPVIYKADGSFDFATLIKGNADLGELTAVVYAPETRDSQGDIASAEVIKDMAYGFAKNGAGVDIRHDNKTLTKDQAYVAENFIVQKGDARFNDMKDYNGKPVDVTGGWATVLKIDDPAIRALFKEGKWNGVSMGGIAQVEADKSADEITAAVLKNLAGHLGIQKKDDIDMDKAELEAVLAKNNAALVTVAVAEVLKALKPDEKAADTTTAPVKVEAPIFKGDPSSPKDIAAHRKAVKLHKAFIAVTDWSDDVQVAKYETELLAINGTVATPVEKTDEVKRLEKELADAQSRSNQGAATVVEGAAATQTVNMDKEMNECMALGAKMAGHINKK